MNRIYVVCLETIVPKKDRSTAAASLAEDPDLNLWLLGKPLIVAGVRATGECVSRV